MIDPKVTELMHLVIDGVASPSQRAELEQALATHAGAREHYEALVATARRLDAHPMVEPPAELHPRVMGAVDVAMSRGLAQARFPGWFSRPVPRFLSTFGLGLATGVFLFAVVRSEKPAFFRAVDPDHVSGTMGAVGQLSPVGTIPVDAPGITGSVDLFQAGNGTRADVTVKSGEPLGWTLSYDPAAPQPYVIKLVRDGSVVFERSAQPVVP